MSFLERTNKLAAAMQVSMRGLAQRIGLSEASLFAYRSGKNTVTEKAWRKLEEAEHRVGILERPVGAHSGARVDLPVRQSTPSTLVASRAAFEQTGPSCRKDCEAYFQLYLDAAEKAADPNAFPFIMTVLKRHFHLSDWEREKLKSEA